MFRTFFFLGMVNLLIVLTLSFFLRLLGIDSSMHQAGMNLNTLAIYCLVWGMGGSFISLMISKWMAKSMMGVKIIDPGKSSGMESYYYLVKMVHQLAKKAGLKEMPEVGIYESDDINAFATGPSKNNSLVAVSTGLLRRMSQDEIEGVLGHEVAHIANGDMVTMTLLQGVMNAFVMFAARIVTMVIDNALRNNSDDEESSSGGLGYFSRFMVITVLEIAFGLLANILVAWFSRYREFRADKGGSLLASKPKMIAALSALERNFEQMTSAQENQDEGMVRAFKISSKDGWFALFSTHPPLKARIEALKNAKGAY